VIYQTRISKYVPEYSESPFLKHFPEQALGLLDGVNSQIFVNNLSEDQFRSLLQRILSGGTDGNPRPLYEHTMIHTHLLPLFQAFADMLDLISDSDENAIFQASTTAAECLEKHYTFVSLNPGFFKLRGWFWGKVKPKRTTTWQEISKMSEDELFFHVELSEYFSDKGIEVEIFELSPRDLKICTFLSFLTTKGFENILDRNANNIPDYVLKIQEQLDGEDINRKGQILNLVNTYISLHIKGAYKSMMGQMLEDPVLFAAISACGLNFQGRNQIPTQGDSFTLDAREQGEHKRQADAVIKLSEDTVLYVDIGFIGPGNPEISSDKQTRFKNAGEDSIIIISKVPEKGKVKEIADNQQTKVIQMCDENWVSELLEYLQERGYSDRVSLGPLVPDTDEILGAMKDAVSRPESW